MEGKKTESDVLPSSSLSTTTTWFGPHSLERRDNVFIFTMNDDENRFNEVFLNQLNAMLDIVERYPSEHLALIITAKGKHWCNGLDLTWLVAQDNHHFSLFVGAFHQFLARYLTLNCVTIAAINGHCFGGGGLWSLAHDYRVMRADKGFWCIPAVDIQIKLTDGFLALLKTKISSPSLLRDVTYTGHRFGGVEAAKFEIVDFAENEDKVLPSSLQIAESLSSKNRHLVGVLKKKMYEKVSRKIRETSGLDKATVLAKL